MGKRSVPVIGGVNTDHITLGEERGEEKGCDRACKQQFIDFILIHEEKENIEDNKIKIIASLKTP